MTCPWFAVEWNRSCCSQTERATTREKDHCPLVRSILYELNFKWLIPVIVCRCLEMRVLKTCNVTVLVNRVCFWACAVWTRSLVWFYHASFVSMIHESLVFNLFNLTKYVCRRIRWRCRCSCEAYSWAKTSCSWQARAVDGSDSAQVHTDPFVFWLVKYF